MRRTLRIALILLSIALISLSFVFLHVKKDRTPTTPKNTKVFIVRNGRQFTLYRNGRPFQIKGAAGSGNLQSLRDAGGNTLRTWDTTNIQHILDEAEANGIAVIAGLFLPVSSALSFYNDTAQVAAQFKAYRNIVLKYKSHPALLMWCLGNEVDFPYRPRFNKFYKAFNNLLDMIHQEDPDHPVTTALINLDRRCIYNIKLKVPGLDLIALNTFGGLSNLHKDLEEFSWFWNGPFIISEWGINGPWESEQTAWGAPIENTSGKKAEQYLERARLLPEDNPRFLGACCFYWGQKQEGTHTWYSFFAPSGAKSEMVNTMQYIWTGTPVNHQAPPVKYMLLEGKGARDNILLKPGRTYEASLILEDSAAVSSLQFHWEILYEDWFRSSPFRADLEKPRNCDSLLYPQPTIKARFRAPSTEGPFRIFVTVYDKKGYFSTANTPFYVLEE